MKAPGAVYAIWWIMLAVIVVVVVPVAVYLLHRLWRAAWSIERYTAEALAAGLGIARHSASLTALDQTVALGGELGTVAGSIRRRAAAIEKTLADRT
jgi:hypothetical protein